MDKEITIVEGTLRGKEIAKNKLKGEFDQGTLELRSCQSQEKHIEQNLLSKAQLEKSLTESKQVQEQAKDSLESYKLWILKLMWD